MLHVILAGHIGLMLLLLGWPMQRGLAEFNGAYGLRTPKTRADPKVWHLANRAAGRAMMLAGGATALGSPALLLPSEAAQTKALLGLVCGPLALAAVYSFWVLARLQAGSDPRDVGTE